MQKILFLLSFFCLIFTSLAYSHEGHHEIASTAESIHPSSTNTPTLKEFGGRPKNVLQWVGAFHFIFLHFPIALITMASFSELLFYFYKKEIFTEASKFMLISAAILGIPTAVLGLMYSYTGTYSNLLEVILLYHMWFGIGTALFTCFVTYLKLKDSNGKLYPASLFILFMMVNITSFLGGEMTFGPYHMFPPAF